MIAENVLGRKFAANTPNRKWVTDFINICTAESWLYVAAVLDLYSHRIVGWSMRSEMMAQLVTDTLMMSIWRCGKPQALLHLSN